MLVGRMRIKEEITFREGRDAPAGVRATEILRNRSETFGSGGQFCDSFES